jgi:large subunit ribosomal protein L18
MAYHAVLRRNRENRTNYRKRAALLIGRRSFVSITISNQNIMAQVLKPSQNGDKVVTSAQSRQLMKYGWKGSMNSLPSCYLTGFLLGVRSLKKGADDMVLYIGKKPYTSGVAACVKGMMDAGVNVPMSDSAMPNAERIRGSHIAQYAETINKDAQKYKMQFSGLLKNGWKPESYPDHFEEVKSKIGNAEQARSPTENRVINNETEING